MYTGVYELVKKEQIFFLITSTFPQCLSSLKKYRIFYRLNSTHTQSSWKVRWGVVGRKRRQKSIMILHLRDGDFKSQIVQPPARAKILEKWLIRPWLDFQFWGADYSGK